MVHVCAIMFCQYMMMFGFSRTCFKKWNPANMQTTIFFRWWGCWKTITPWRYNRIENQLAIHYTSNLWQIYLDSVWSKYNSNGILSFPLVRRLIVDEQWNQIHCYIIVSIWQVVRQEIQLLFAGKRRLRPINVCATKSDCDYLTFFQWSIVI